MAGNNAGALAAYDDQALLDRISAGLNPAKLANELGVHKSAIYHRFAGNPKYEAARLDGMSVRVEESEEEIASADDQFTLSRAREKFRAVAWRAEREFPNRWGAKQQLTHEIGESFAALLEQVSRKRQAQNSQIIDVTPEKQELTR